MKILGSIALLCLSATPSHAADAITPEQTTFIFNTLLFLMSGAFVMWMAAGFCMLEAGLVRSKNVAMQCTKNIVVYAVAGIVYGLIGYNLMYPADNWLITKMVGFFSIYQHNAHSSEDVAYASKASDFFYQLAFCATTASIVSGAVAERIKFSSFMWFSVLLTAIIYPIAGSWGWGGGFLKDMGFKDFAGSTFVHSVGGWAAVTGLYFVGNRYGRFTKNGRSVPFRASNLPLATLGCLILWLGWLFFNGGSQLALGTLENASDVSRIFINTNMAASTGVVGCLLLTYFRYGKIDLTMVINGALGGLVAITAEPLTPSFIAAGIIGLVASVLVVFAVELLEKFKIDDVVGALPVHLVCGVFGTLIVPITNPDASFVTQLIGIVCICSFTLATTAIAWKIVELAGKGLRPTLEEEIEGLDSAEMGMDAYPDFIRNMK